MTATVRIVFVFLGGGGYGAVIVAVGGYGGGYAGGTDGGAPGPGAEGGWTMGQHVLFAGKELRKKRFRRKSPLRRRVRPLSTEAFKNGAQDTRHQKGW